MLEFHPLTAANFPRFEEEILRSEAIFPENIRESGEDYLAALKRQRAVGLVARHGQAYVGNVVGFAPCREQRQVLRLNEHSAPEDAGLIYLFNIVTMPEFQGRGCGKHLLGEFCQRARQRGFHKVGGHFRGNGSLKNFTGLGGRPLAVCHDWFATGESYTYCELLL